MYVQGVPNTLYKAGCLPLNICKPQICSRAPFPTNMLWGRQKYIAEKVQIIDDD